MNPRQFNGIYRPLVQQAWFQYCSKAGISPNHKDAYNVWYQGILMDLSGGKVHSTKGASPKMQQLLIDRFKDMIGQDTMQIEGEWTEAQLSRFNDLAKSAYRMAQISRKVPDFRTWLTSICERNGYLSMDGEIRFPDCTSSFDSVMADLAVIAQDEYWIDRTAAAAERRMRWQIEQFMADLDFLDKRFDHTWDYIRGIYKQSQSLPLDIDDCPAQILWRILQMLDTHIRRLCDDFGIRPMELPTRSHPHVHPTISEQAKHLHVGHELEHIAAPIHVAAGGQESDDDVPF